MKILRSNSNVDRTRPETSGNFIFFPFLVQGLADSVNPCALMALVYFLFYLLTSKLSHRGRWLFGGFFITSVLMTNSFVGWGGLAYFRSLEIYYVIAKSLYIFLALLSICFGGIFFYDGWRLRKAPGEKSPVINFPFLEEKISEQRPIRFRKADILVCAKIVITAVVFGAFSIFFQEGNIRQIVVPLVHFMTKTPELETQILLCLVVYNVMFILPLAFFFVGLQHVTGSEKWRYFFRKHLSKIRMAFAGLFLGIGLGMLYMDI